MDTFFRFCSDINASYLIQQGDSTKPGKFKMWNQNCGTTSNKMLWEP